MDVFRGYFKSTLFFLLHIDLKSHLHIPLKYLHVHLGLVFQSWWFAFHATHSVHICEISRAVWFWEYSSLNLSVGT